MQTALDWLFNSINEKLNFKMSLNYKELFEQAKEMEKQQIIDAHLIGLITSLEMEATKQATEYYNETYGSKGSDSTLNSTLKSTLNASSQTEISDEEIWNEAKIWALEELITSVDSFVDGAKWYREQLKKKQ